MTYGKHTSTIGKLHHMRLAARHCDTKAKLCKRMQNGFLIFLDDAERRAHPWTKWIVDFANRKMTCGRFTLVWINDGKTTRGGVYCFENK